MKTTLIISPKSKALLEKVAILGAKKAELEKLYEKALKEEAAAEEKTVSTSNQK